MSNGMPDGTTFSGKEASELLKEFKTLNGSLGQILKTLNKTANADMFTKKDNLGETLKREFSNLDSTLKDSGKSNQDYLKKAEKVLDNFDKYAKANEDLKKLTKEELTKIVDLEKNRLNDYKELLALQRIQKDMLEGMIGNSNKLASENIKNYDRNRSLGKSTQEDKELARRQLNDSDNFLGEAIKQTLLDSNPIVRMLATKFGKATSLDQTKKNREFADDNTRAEWRKDANMQHYDASNSADVNDALFRSNQDGYNENAEGQINDLRSRLNGGSGIDRVSGMLDNLKEPKTNDNYKRQIRRSNGTLGPLKKSNILQFPKSVFGGGSSSEYEDLDSIASGAADSKKDTVSLTPSANDVKRLLGDAGAGYLYLGTLLDKLINNNSGKKLEDEVKKSDGGGDGLLGLFKGLKELLPILKTVAPILLAAGLAWNVGESIVNNSKDLNNAQAIIDGKDTGLSPKEAVRVLDTKSRQETNASFSGYGNDEVSPGASAWRHQQYLIKKYGKEGAVALKGFNDTVYSKGSTWLPTNDGGWEATFADSPGMKFHNGGVVTVQNGEGILPVDQTQQGLSSGMLQQTPSGGLRLNSEQKTDMLLEKILEVLSGSLLTAMKENKPTEAKESVYFNPLPKMIPSYGSN